MAELSYWGEYGSVSSFSRSRSYPISVARKENSAGKPGLGLHSGHRRHIYTQEEETTD